MASRRLIMLFCMCLHFNEQCNDKVNHSCLKGYCEAILPAPQSLTLPMCWSDDRLDELQHDSIKDGALLQKVGCILHDDVNGG